MSTCDDRMEDGVEEDRMDVEPGQEEEHEENMESDDDMDDEDDEDDEDEHRLEPIMDGRNITFRTSILRKFLICPLCKGFFREPHTVRECLHTYCKGCIFKEIHHGVSHCPECKVSLAPRPLEAIQYDRTLHEIVNKIFPDLVAADEAAKKKFYDDKGLPVPDATPEKKAEASDPKVVRYKDEIQFRLEYDESSKEPEEGPKLGPLKKPIITTSARVTMRHLKKFLSMELKFPDINNIDLLYKEEVLGAEHSLEYILKSRGHKSDEEAVLTYRHRDASFNAP